MKGADPNVQNKYVRN